LDRVKELGVGVSAFQMDVDEVTNAEYKRCVDDGACTRPTYSWSDSARFYWGNPTYNDFPVT
jgi:formylglycine-generating enzyme required for sulfatase activity